MTDLESPRKNNDCYFYYYSTCAKGDSCTFRHEPSALGCETMCSFWKEGKCMNVHCNFRHMELRKNRKAIPCYWESQPNGCLKSHCPFMHQNPRPGGADESLDSCKTDSGTESADNTMNDKMTQMTDKSFKKTPVDSLVVNFEEESDNESAPNNSPAKTTQQVKTLEELKLEEIQAESAAYYSFPGKIITTTTTNNDDLRQRIRDRVSSKKRLIINPNDHIVDCVSQSKKARIEETITNVTEIKIKTLDEIRAERAKNPRKTIDVCDSSVTSSTCIDDAIASTTSQNTPVMQRKKLKLQRNKPILFHPKESNENHPAVPESFQGDDGIAPTANSPIDTDSIKALDEVLLLQDDDDNSNVSLKEEEELLNDSDDLMDD